MFSQETHLTRTGIGIVCGYITSTILFIVFAFVFSTINVVGISYLSSSTKMAENVYCILFALRLATKFIEVDTTQINIFLDVHLIIFVHFVCITSLGNAMPHGATSVPTIAASGIVILYTMLHIALTFNAIMTYRGTMKISSRFRSR